MTVNELLLLLLLTVMREGDEPSTNTIHTTSLEQCQHFLSGISKLFFEGCACGEGRHVVTRAPEKLGELRIVRAIRFGRTIDYSTIEPSRARTKARCLANFAEGGCHAATATTR